MQKTFECCLGGTSLPTSPTPSQIVWSKVRHHFVQAVSACVCSEPAERRATSCAQSPGATMHARMLAARLLTVPALLRTYVGSIEQHHCALTRGGGRDVCAPTARSRDVRAMAATSSAAVAPPMPPFHLAFPVHDLSAARDFYGRCGVQTCSIPNASDTASSTDVVAWHGCGQWTVKLGTRMPAMGIRLRAVRCPAAVGRVLGCSEGRSADRWQDYSLFGHQVGSLRSRRVVLRA